MSELAIVGLKNNILVDSKRNEVKNKIIERLNALSIPFVLYRNDLEMLALVCNLVEYLVTKKDKISKSDVVIDVYKNYFPDIEEFAISTIKKNIDFLHQNKAIKKVSFYKMFVCSFKEYFKKST